MAEPVSSLLVRIGADVGGLERGARQGSRSLDDLGRQAAALGARMAALGAAAAAVGAAFTAKLVKSGLEAIDAQAKLARSLDASIDGLRGLQLAANDAGVGNEQLSQGLRNLNARLGEAMRGTGEAKKTLDTLGLSARALSQLDTDQRMSVIADRMRELGLSSAQAADLLRKLGFENENFVPLMLAGGDAIRQARQDVDAFGISLSAVDAAKVEMANDAMARIGLTFEAIRNQITIAFAPILKALADRFNELAKENKGFGDVAINVAERVVRSFAKVADIVHILQTALKGLQLAFATIGEIFWKVIAGVADGFAKFADGVTSRINVIIRGLNSLGANLTELPSIADSDFMNGLRSVADTASEITDRVRTEFLDLLGAEWPSAGIEAFLADIKAHAQEAAEAIAGVQPGGGTFESEDEGAKKDQERLQKELEAQRAALEAKLQMIREYAMTEEEEEIYRHEERMARLTEGLEAELLTRQEYQELEATLVDQHMQRLQEIRQKGMTALQKFMAMSWDNQLKTAMGALSEMTAGASRESRKMFELNKAAGIANATIAMFQGIAEGVKLGWPAGIAAVAWAAAQGAAAISSIKSTSFSGGGGGTAPSLAGSPGTPVTPVASSAPAQSGVIVVEGIDEKSLFSGRAVRELAEKLQEHIRDGGTVRFA